MLISSMYTVGRVVRRFPDRACDIVFTYRQDCRSAFGPGVGFGSASVLCGKSFR